MTTGPTPDLAARVPLSRDEFARAFQAHRALFLCLAASVLGARTQAEDVVQEAAIVGLAKLDDFAPGSHFGAWMGRIVRYVALNHARASARSSSTRSGKDVERAESPARPSPVALDFDDRLMRALASLT